ncbi:MAG: response regulator transcription factor [Alphaproteobacteria bacterium]|nr:response regulator transcription factor [Alphaproteobacteria bacterium]
MKILIIDDEVAIAKRIATECEKYRYVCHIANTGVDAIDLLSIEDYTLIILDLMLPDISGFEIMCRVRSLKKETPIIVLSGLSSIEQKIDCFTAGADDYITKPFSKQELFARIKAVTRRLHGYSSSSVTLGPVEVRLDKQLIITKDKEIKLTAKEYGILELLVLRKGSILPKEVFLSHIYGGINEPDSKIIDVIVCKLRKKITAATGGFSLIETVWGRGYIIRTDQTDQDLNENLDEMPALKAG